MGFLDCDGDPSNGCEVHAARCPSSVLVLGDGAGSALPGQLKVTGAFLKAGYFNGTLVETTVVASWNDGTPLVVVRNNLFGTGRSRVDLNLYPPNGGGDFLKLIANALQYP